MELKLRLTRRRVAMAVVLVALITVGVAYATIPNGNGVYTACKLNSTGTVRLIDPSLGGTSLLGRCTSLETQLTWNEQGQKGEQGPQGVPGPKGDKGDPGATGVSTLEGKSCPSGQAVTGFSATGELVCGSVGGGATGFCGIGGDAIPAPGTMHANWTCSGNDAVIASCTARFFDANGSSQDGCEFEQDSHEPNDTQATAESLPTLHHGSFSVFGNVTPGNDDWYRVRVADCSILLPCQVVLQAIAPAASMAALIRDDGLRFFPGQTDVVSVDHDYFVFVGGAPYFQYQFTVSS